MKVPQTTAQLCKNPKMTQASQARGSGPHGPGFPQMAEESQHLPSASCGCLTPSFKFSYPPRVPVSPTKRTQAQGLRNLPKVTGHSSARSPSQGLGLGLRLGDCGLFPHHGNQRTPLPVQSLPKGTPSPRKTCPQPYPQPYRARSETDQVGIGTGRRRHPPPGQQGRETGAPGQPRAQGCRSRHWGGLAQRRGGEEVLATRHPGSGLQPGRPDLGLSEGGGRRGDRPSLGEDGRRGGWVPGPRGGDT